MHSKKRETSKSKRMETKLTPLLGHIDDLSILNDELGRTRFAQGLSKLILAHPPNKCTILGLEGAWGTGKSYTIEMVRRELALNPKVKWVPFNPWYFTDREHLASLLLATLIQKLDAGTKPSFWEKARKYSKYCARFIGRWGANAWVVSLIVSTVLGTLLGANKVVALFGLSLPVLPSIISWLLSFTPSNSNLSSLSQLLTDYADTLDEFENPDIPPTLARLKNDICAKISDNKFPFERIIIAVEDLDRLEPKEVQVMVQVMRMVVDFPRITYLVGYDKEQVVRALGEIAGSNIDKEHALKYGAGYLQKVVHTAYSLPVVNSWALANHILSRFRQMVEPIYGKDFVETSYWQKIAPLFIELWATMRDGEKVINRALIMLSMLQEKSNPIDVLAASHLMENQSKLWHWIWQNQDQILGGGRKLVKSSHQTTLSNHIQSFNGEYINDQIEGDQKTKDNIINLLRLIFPSLEYDGAVNHTIEERGQYPLGNRDFFESYFKYDVTPSGELQKLIPQLLNTKKRSSIMGKILAYGDNGIMIALRDLKELSKSTPLNWHKEALPLLEDLAQTLDAMPQSIDLFGMLPADRVYWLTVSWINALKIEQRSQAIQEVITRFLKVNARYLALSLYEKIALEGGWINYSEGQKPSELPFDLTLEEEDKVEIQTIIQDSLKSWAEHEPVKWLSHPMASLMLYQWLRIDKKQAQQTISKWTEDDWMLFPLLRTMMKNTYTLGLSSKQGGVSQYKLSQSEIKAHLGISHNQLKKRVKQASRRNPYGAKEHPDIVAEVEGLPDNEQAL